MEKLTERTNHMKSALQSGYRGVIAILMFLILIFLVNRFHSFDVVPAAARTDRDIAAHIEAQRQNAVKVIDGGFFSEMIEVAKAKPRKRQIFDYTASPETDTLQRFFNAWQLGSYAPVHRHTFGETFLVLEGLLAFFTFNDEGNLQECRVLGPGVNTNRGMQSPLGVDVQAGVWHTMTPVTKHAVVWETSAQVGGYHGPASAKEYAKWCPEEGSSEVQPFLEELISKCEF